MIFFDSYQRLLHKDLRLISSKNQRWAAAGAAQARLLLQGLQSPHGHPFKLQRHDL